MSASPVARQAVSHVQEKGSLSPMKNELLPQMKSLPRKIVINSPSELPHDYSTTPGGTLFSTTPGGTRIVYERNFLLNLRNSPLARSPLKNLPVIPGVTTKDNAPEKENTSKSSIPEEVEPEKQDEQEQFAMDL